MASGIDTTTRRFFAFMICVSSICALAAQYFQFKTQTADADFRARELAEAYMRPLVASFVTAQADGTLNQSVMQRTLESLVHSATGVFSASLDAQGSTIAQAGPESLGKRGVSKVQHTRIVCRRVQFEARRARQ